MWHEDRGKATLVDPEGQVHRLHAVVATPKKYKRKYASGNTKPAEMKAAKLSTLQTMIRGNVPSSFDNRQTRQSKAASSSDKIKVDFHTDATFSNRIPNRAFIVIDYNRKDFLMQEAEQRRRTI